MQIGTDKSTIRGNMLYLAETNELTLPEPDILVVAKLVAGYVKATRMLLLQDYSCCVPSSGARWYD